MKPRSLAFVLASVALASLVACSGAGDESVSVTTDPPSPLPDGGKPKPKDAGVATDGGTDGETGSASCAPNGIGTVTQLATTDRQYGVDRLQAYSGVLYWQTSDSYGPDGSAQVSAYVLAQKRFFTIYGKPTWLNVNSRGVYFTDFQLHRYGLAGGSGTVFPTLSGYYPTLRADGGYEYMIGSAADRSDFQLRVTDADGQTTGNGLQGALTEFVAADATHVYFALYTKPLSGQRETQLVRANRNLDFSSLEGIGTATDQEPTGLALDGTNVFLATDGAAGTTDRCTKTATNGQCITLSNVAGNENLVTTSSYLYFTPKYGNQLLRVKKDGSSKPEVVFTACGRVVSIAADGDVVYFIATTPVGKNGILIGSVQ